MADPTPEPRSPVTPSKFFSWLETLWVSVSVPTRPRALLLWAPEGLLLVAEQVSKHLNAGTES